MKRMMCTAAAAVMIMAGGMTAMARTHEPGHTVTESPRVPSEVTFAGVKIDLDRNDMWERLDRELTSIMYTQSNTLLTLKRANRYFPVMAPILKKNGIPEDMLYLACIESLLDDRAVSIAKAGGVWQFMPETGRQYGLEVNENVDERYNLEKATEAACKYFKAAYAKYGNWESAAASYNAGMGRISGEMSRQGEKSAYDLYLVNETNRYIFRLLAQKMIMENPGHYGFMLSDEDLYQPIDYEVTEVNGPVADWQQWAKEHGSNYMTLRMHNPWIRSTKLPNASGKVYKVKLPKKEWTKRSTTEKKIYNSNWTR